MELSAEATVPHPPGRVFPAVADMATYPEWMGVVHRVVPVVAHADDPGPAWSVHVGARIGPLRATKQLRIVRTVHEPDEHVRFERLEHDGRDHGEWILEARLGDGGEGSRVRMFVAYLGSKWLPVFDFVLRDEVRRAPERLAAYLT